jgi:hypothetical protein
MPCLMRTNSLIPYLGAAKRRCGGQCTCVRIGVGVARPPRLLSDPLTSIRGAVDRFQPEVDMSSALGDGSKGPAADMTQEDGPNVHFGK